MGYGFREQLRRAVVGRDVRLPLQTSFRIVDVAERSDANGDKWVQVFGRSDRGEPGVRVLVGTAKYSAGMSPLSAHSFVLHIPVQKFPRFLSDWKIPVEVGDAKNHVRAQLSVRMWARDDRRGIPADVVE